MQHDQTCPVCGGPLAEVPVTFIPDRGMVVGNGRFSLVTPAEMALLAHLAKHYPNIVSHGRLLDALPARDHADPREIKLVDVYVCKLRKKLDGLGVVIETHWGRGYSLGVPVRLARSADAA